MNERDIQRALMADRYRRSFVLPNYTPAGWWECDVFEITQAGYFREYEIKLSRSDFLADAKKMRQDWDEKVPTDPSQGFTYVKRAKHACMGQPNGPQQFYYVCPRGLVKESEVPSWAGFIEVVTRPHYHRPPWNVSELTIRKAPKLHKEKLNPKILERARGTHYWRFNSLFIYNKMEDAPTAEPEYSI